MTQIAAGEQVPRSRRDMFFEIFSDVWPSDSEQIGWIDTQPLPSAFKCR